MPAQKIPAEGLEESFNEFYLAAWQRVVTFGYAMVGDLREAYDIAREAFVTAWQRWHRVVHYADPEAWVRMVASVLLIDRWREAQTRPLGYHGRGPDGVVDPPSIESLVLVTALRQLPADQRYAIVLHHVLGVPVSEVSEQSGVRVNAARARLASGRRTLSELLGWDLPEEEDRATAHPRFTALYRDTGTLALPSAASLRRHGQQPPPSPPVVSLTSGPAAP